MAETITVTTASLPAATVGVAYEATLAATGATSALTWAISVGTLPDGLEFDSAAGKISGTPTTEGSTNLTFTATDGTATGTSAALTLAVKNAVKITTATLPEGEVNVPYNVTLAAEGGSGSYTWTVASGSLPDGIELSASTGKLSGTPTAEYTGSVSFSATDGTTTDTTAALTLAVSGPLEIQYPSSTIATNTQINIEPVVISGTPVSYAVSPALPTGLTLDATTGAVTGTATAAAALTDYQITATDANKATATATLVLTILEKVSVADVPEVYTTVGTNVVIDFQVSNGSGPRLWRVVDGTLPPGIQVGVANTYTQPGTAPFLYSDQLVGVPTESGLFIADIACQDDTATVITTVSIDVADPLKITVDGQKFVDTSDSVSLVPNVSGGFGPMTVKQTGTLPTGVTADTTTQALSGTVTQAGTFPIVYTATDSKGNTASLSLSIVVRDITTASMTPAELAIVALLDQFTTLIAAATSANQWAQAAGILAQAIYRINRFPTDAVLEYYYNTVKPLAGKDNTLLLTGIASLEGRQSLITNMMLVTTLSVITAPATVVNLDSFLRVIPNQRIVTWFEGKLGHLTA